MKTAAVLITILATLATSHAQEPAASPRRITTKSSEPTGQPVAGTSQPAPDANYTLTISGSVGDSQAFNTTLGGTGPRFTANLINPTRKIEILVTQKEGVFEMTYAIVAQLPITNGSNTQYCDTSVTGTFLATPGQPFPVLKEGDKTLSIEIDKTKK